MSVPITAGTWRAGPLRRSSANWPFHWTAEITTIDPATRQHQLVGRFTQPGSRPFAEIRTNLTATILIPDMIRTIEAIAEVIAMSDPDSATFADSAADCLDALLIEAPAIAAILTALRGSGTLQCAVSGGGRTRQAARPSGS